MRPNCAPSSNRKSCYIMRNADLGDEETTDSSGDLASDFQTPERDSSVTDYGLDTTDGNTGGRFLSEHQKRTLLHQLQKKLKATTGEPSGETRPEQCSGGGTSLQQKTGVVNTEVETKKQGQKKPRKQKTPMEREKIFWKDVMRLQKKDNNLVPCLPFSRLVQEILVNTAKDATKITRTALEALQESSEMYLTQQLQDAYTLTLHRGRVTLAVSDMELLRYIRGKEFLY